MRIRVLGVLMRKMVNFKLSFMGWDAGCWSLDVLYLRQDSGLTISLFQHLKKS